jgi:hypothetical protein
MLFWQAGLSFWCLAQKPVQGRTCEPKDVPVRGREGRELCGSVCVCSSQDAK